MPNGPGRPCAPYLIFTSEFRSRAWPHSNARARSQPISAVRSQRRPVIINTSPTCLYNCIYHSAQSVRSDLCKKRACCAPTVHSRTFTRVILVPLCLSPSGSTLLPSRRRFIRAARWPPTPPPLQTRRPSAARASLARTAARSTAMRRSAATWWVGCFAPRTWYSATPSPRWRALAATRACSRSARMAHAAMPGHTVLSRMRMLQRMLHIAQHHQLPLRAHGAPRGHSPRPAPPPTPSCARRRRSRTPTSSAAATRRCWRRQTWSSTSAACTSPRTRCARRSLMPPWPAKAAARAAAARAARRAEGRQGARFRPQACWGRASRSFAGAHAVRSSQTAPPPSHLSLPLSLPQRFDHHQRGFTEVFGHGYVTKLSSAGLVYKHYGRAIVAQVRWWAKTARRPGAARLPGDARVMWVPCARMARDCPSSCYRSPPQPLRPPPPTRPFPCLSIATPAHGAARGPP